MAHVWMYPHYFIKYTYICSLFEVFKLSIIRNYVAGKVGGIKNVDL